MNRGLPKADLVGLGIAFLLLALLSTVFAQATTRENELDNRRTCAANLRGIAQSANVYAADNSDVFPLLVPSSATTYDVTMKEDKGSKDAEAALPSLYKEKKYSNNPSANLWVMVLTGQVVPKQFICKSDPFATMPATVKTEAGEYLLNFQDAKNISYSSIYPWAEKDGKVVGAGSWKCLTDAGLPMLSDMAPYMGKKGKEVATRPWEGASTQAAAATATGLADVDDEWATKKASSQNHQFQGENIGYSDAHVEFARTPSMGESNESIWGIVSDAKGSPPGKEQMIEAGQLPHPVGGSMGNFDTVMVPTRDAKGNLK